MAAFEARDIKVLGISMDSAKSHRKFIENHQLHDITLLSDEDGKLVDAYDADHWLLPVASRVYIIVDRNREIIFRSDQGLSKLDNQTETLLKAIDEHIK